MLRSYTEGERHAMILEGETEEQRLEKIEWWYLFIVNKGNLRNFESKYGKPQYHTLKDIEDFNNS